ncbi:MAG: glycosyltransferase family 2 protein [Candidatus Cloacimonetes bacterium]|nr:glycosyltransferase family 2 protein [Candidatus Cloacimonadota bacterium]
MQNVDVIIPTHNCIFINEAIRSVLDQGYHNINIFVVDDGSTDNTREKVSFFLSSNPQNIHYIYQKQQGPAGARNTGIKKSAGEYIAFLDADDVWLPDKIEKQLKILSRDTDIGFVYCDNYFIDKKGKKIKDYIRKIKLVEGNILLDFFLDFFLITSGIVLKRSCLEKVGLFNKNLQVGEDFEFFLRLAKDFKARVVKEKLFLRRVWTESLSKKDYELNRNTDILTLQTFVQQNEDFRKQNSSLINFRISQLYTNLGYAYLSHKQKIKALQAFFEAEKCKPKTFKLKYLLLCLLPIFLTKTIQRIIHEKS